MDDFSSHDKMVVPGEYNLEALTLISYNGISVDIRSNVIELIVHEDIYQNFLSGEILIGENVNLIRHLPLIGNETIEITFLTPSRTMPIKQRFFVYKIGDKADLDNSYKTNIYRLFFCSIPCIKSQQTKISRSFANLTHAEMVTAIYNDYLSDGKKIVVQPTLGKKHLVIPYMSPMAAINMIAKKSMSGDGKDVSYLFYETMNSYEFTTINYLAKVQKEPDITFQYAAANVTRQDGSYRELNSDIRRIEKYDIITLNNTIKNLHDGVFASRMLTHDITYKKFMFTDYLYNQNHQELTTLHPHGMLPKTEQNFSMSPMANYQYYPKHSYAYDGVLDNDECEAIVPKRNAHMAHFDTFRLSALVAGDTNRRVGEIVGVKIFAGETHHNVDDDPFDYYLSGKYIITKITHILQKESYKMRLSLERDSLPHPYPDQKEWSST